jgi:hypothetical protein
MLVSSKEDKKRIATVLFASINRFFLCLTKFDMKWSVLGVLGSNEQPIEVVLMGYDLALDPE